MTEAPKISSGEYLAPRRCLREPIPEMYRALALLNEAADAHLAERSAQAKLAIKEADIPAIRDWIESLWGRKDLYPDKVSYLRIRAVDNLPPRLSNTDRVKSRAPTRSNAREIIKRYGWNCAYCKIGLIDRSARAILRARYPEALRWGSTNNEKHVAFMYMNNEFDHVLPHSRGGTNDLENLVPCCAPCNCGKENYTLEQLGLADPRKVETQPYGWDGLTRLLGT